MGNKESSMSEVTKFLVERNSNKFQSSIEDLSHSWIIEGKGIFLLNNITESFGYKNYWIII